MFVIDILTIRLLSVLTDAKGDGEWAGAGLCIELSEAIRILLEAEFIF